MYIYFYIRFSLILAVASRKNYETILGYANYCDIFHYYYKSFAVKNYLGYIILNCVGVVGFVLGI